MQTSVLGSRGWWHFWNASAWHDWSAAKAAMFVQKATRSDLARRIDSKAAAVVRAEEFEAKSKRAIGWVNGLSPKRLAIPLIVGEIGLGSVGGVTLSEKRRKLLKNSWVEVALGVIYFTEHRVIFLGSERLAFEYKDLTEASRESQGLRMTVLDHAYLFGGPAEQIEISLAAAQVLARGEDPMVTVLEAHSEACRQLAGHIDELQWLKQQFATLGPEAKPRSPAWLPVVILALGLVATVGADYLFGTRV